MSTWPIVRPTFTSPTTFITLPVTSYFSSILVIFLVTYTVTRDWYAAQISSRNVAATWASRPRTSYFWSICASLLLTPSLMLYFLSTDSIEARARFAPCSSALVSAENDLRILCLSNSRYPPLWGQKYIGRQRYQKEDDERRGILKEVRSDGSSLFGLPVSDGWYKGEFQSTRPTGTANGGRTWARKPRRRNPGCSKAVLIFSLPALRLYDRTETARDSGGLDVTLAVAY